MEEVASSPSLKEIFPMNLKALGDLEFMKSSHDYDLVVSVILLDHL